MDGLFFDSAGGIVGRIVYALDFQISETGLREPVRGGRALPTHRADYSRDHPQPVPA